MDPQPVAYVMTTNLRNNVLALPGFHQGQIQWICPL